MKAEQYVMAYSVEQDRLRAILPNGFISSRPVLRINVEIGNGNIGYVEFNTAIEKNGCKGWLNIGFWNDILFERNDKTVSCRTDFLYISFQKLGVKGSCPAEKDNSGCFFIRENIEYKKTEAFTGDKEFCDCEFAWKFSNTDAHGASTGKTFPAYPTEVKKRYPRKSFTIENAAEIPCEQVLGAYMIEFER